MKTTGMHLSWIVVKNLDEAIRFYRDVIGLTLKEYNKEFAWVEFCGPEGQTLGITQENPVFHMKSGTNAVVTISVENMENAIATLKKNGAKLVGVVMEVPGEVKLQTFEDESGNTFQLAEDLKNCASKNLS